MPGTDSQGRALPAPRKLAWCNGWQFPCDKLTIKYSSTPYMVGHIQFVPWTLALFVAQNKGGSAFWMCVQVKLQRWLAENSSTGLLTRQVSQR